jgi:hypothetical protein
LRGEHRVLGRALYVAVMAALPGRRARLAHDVVVHGLDECPACEVEHPESTASVAEWGHADLGRTGPE